MTLVCLPGGCGGPRHLSALGPENRHCVRLLAPFFISGGGGVGADSYLLPIDNCVKAVGFLSYQMILSPPSPHTNVAKCPTKVTSVMFTGGLIGGRKYTRESI